MKKEVVIAIIGGFVLGLVITFGIATAQRSLRNQTTSGPTPTLGPNQSPPQTHPLFITSPQPNSITKDALLRVSGSTTPNSMVAITTTNDQNSTVADFQGTFSLTIELLPGTNILEAVSYNPLGLSTSQKFKVVYATPPVTAIPTPTPKGK